MTGDVVSEQQEDRPRPAGVSRRRLFGWLGAGTAGVVAAGATGGLIGRSTAQEPAPSAAAAADDAVPFTGAHQAGIVTPAQDRLHFVALDVVTDVELEHGARGHPGEGPVDAQHAVVVDDRAGDDAHLVQGVGVVALELAGAVPEPRVQHDDRLAEDE